MTRLLSYALDVVKERARFDTDFREVASAAGVAIPESRYERYVRESDRLATSDWLQHQLIKDSYNFFPYLFWPLYPSLSRTHVHHISVAARFYADHLILTDHVADGDEAITDRWLSVLKASRLHERSLQLLHEQFPVGSPFWQEYRTHYEQFAVAVLSERDLVEQEPWEAEDLGLLADIASGKSAMSKCAPAALATLASDFGDLSRIYELLDDIGFGVQVTDDLQDWRRDLRDRRLTYVLAAFCSEQHVTLAEIGNGADRRDTERRFYTSAAVRDALATARDRLVLAGAAPELHACEDLRGSLERHVGRIDYIEEQIVNAVRRVVRLRTMEADRDPAARAIAFLTHSQAADGYWSDFFTSASESTDWVTGYVAAALPDEGQGREARASASTWLMRQQFPDGAWGYRRSVAPDADSTAACLTFLASTLPTEVLARAECALLAHQDTTGGFQTYTAPAVIAPVMNIDPDSVDFAGWCAPQHCVTAAAVIALVRCAQRSALPEEHLVRRLDDAVRFLIGAQTQTGSWRSYWWHGDIYATALTLRALCEVSDVSAATPEQVGAACERAAARLLSLQNDDGGWAATRDDPSCPFQTALAVRALLRYPGPGDIRAVSSARRGVAHLIATQLANGSWRAAVPIMRLPHPDDVTPWDQVWQREPGSTLGSLIVDHNRIFTTATALSALLAHAATG